MFRHKILSFMESSTEIMPFCLELSSTLQAEIKIFQNSTDEGGSLWIIPNCEAYITNLTKVLCFICSIHMWLSIDTCVFKI